MQIVRIGNGSAGEPSAETIGAKAANLARMAALGLPVPPAFVLPVNLCNAIGAGDPDAAEELRRGLTVGVAFLEQVTGRRFADRRRPLLVSARSGAARSMPGMLDTVLDVGCTLTAVRGLVRMTGNPRFAWDCRCRLLEGYGETVLGLDPALFAARRAAVAAQEDVGERELDSEALMRLAAEYLALVNDHAEGLPEDAVAQLVAATHAVYRSWMSDRAQTYRRLQGLDQLKGTAVTVQAMVYGNRGLASGAGVAFSRDPSTGAREPVIDVMFDAQGEDVVSGRCMPDTEAAIIAAMPALAGELRTILTTLERAFGDVQDIEFTIEDGKLWILQTRAAKRTPRAALRIAIDLVDEGLITPQQGLHRLEGLDLSALADRHLVAPGDPAARGIGASAGMAVGRAAFATASAERLAVCDPVILLRNDISTSDIAGFAAAAGIVTAIGGRTAHAALVARQMGKPCVVGCSGLAVDAASGRAQLGARVIGEGEWIAIDGDAGFVYLGRRDIVTERPDAELATVARWRAATASARAVGA
jgi:pyruvate, orthophosphate dikinase